MSPFDLKAALTARHAQHVVLVHFPIALFLAGVAFDLAARWTRKSVFSATRNRFHRAPVGGVYAK